MFFFKITQMTAVAEEEVYREAKVTPDKCGDIQVHLPHAEADATACSISV